MPLGRFIFWTALGSLMWNAGLMYVGYSLGSAWDQVAKYTHYLDAFVVILLIVGLVYWWRKHGRILATGWQAPKAPVAPPPARSRKKKRIVKKSQSRRAKR